MPRKIGTLLFSKKIVLLDEVCLEHDKVFSQHFQKSFVKSSITISQTPRRFFAKAQKLVRFHRRKIFFEHTHHTDDNVTVFFFGTLHNDWSFSRIVSLNFLVDFDKS